MILDYCFQFGRLFYFHRQISFKNYLNHSKVKSMLSTVLNYY
jgi:hypothetical protein